MESDKLPTTDDVSFEDRVQDYSDEMAEFLSDTAKGLQKINRVPRKGYKKERFLQAMQEAFEIIGGVPRLAVWADKNQDEFYKLCGKTVPALVQQINNNVNVPIQIVSAIPRSPLDGECEEVPNVDPKP